MNEHNGSPLFETKTELTFDECKKLWYAIHNRRPCNRIMRILLVVLLAVDVVLGVFLLVAGAPVYVAVFCIVISAAAMTALLLLPIYGARVYKRQLWPTDRSEAELRFYPGWLEERAGENISNLSYNKIYDIIETKTNFYIMISNVQAVPVIKEGCPDGLADFIRGIKARLGEIKSLPGPEPSAPREDGKETPLYEVRSVIGWEEYKRYSLYVSGRQPRNIVITFIGLTCLVLGLCLVRYSGWLLAVLGAVLLLELFIIPRIKGRNYYRSNKFAQDKEIIVRFYSDRLESRDANGRTLLKYGDIQKIYETETNFYIMISQALGIILVKYNCGPELTEFVRKLKTGEKVG